ncbi:MAG: C10 family peptidase [Bacteroidales bacterium]|nr:C10 family peptidase [Bacteroidales bacterium]
MKNRLLLLLALTLSVGCLFAGPVDLATAQKVGVGFAQTALSQSAKADALQLVSATDHYYVFNVGTNGFVLVSADDRFRPIVGYSDEGCFPTENASPEMMYYLDNLSQGRQMLSRAVASADPQVVGEWEALLRGERLPSRNGNRAKFYLLTTKWNQNAPYNKFCPGNSYAGCVATAMSQVMNYWKYPTHGWGHHSYYHYQWGELAVDFSSSVYDFDKMPNGIAADSDPEYIDAIAKFMYDCGVAVDMDYSTDGSGAYSQDVPDAVLKYFGYTNRCRIYSRDAFDLAEFHQILKDQFDLGWPCYYSGSDTEGQGGHAFVCDGYDENDLFHFNWGWSGSGNGFFAIDELNVSGYMFNSGQAVITNFVPPFVFENTAKAPDYLTAVPNGDEDFSVTLSWVNPTATLDGRPLEAIDQIVVERDGVVVGLYENPVPGASVTQVIPTRLPAMVNYRVYAVCNGYSGRKAHADGINLGPVCDWQIRCYSPDQIEGSRGMLTLFNAAGSKLGEFVPETEDRKVTMEVPQGRVTMSWTAPADSMDVAISILDAEGQTVFDYAGPSVNMPTGIFFETVNTCGGAGSLVHPSDLTAEVEGENVLLHWTGIPDPGYGYNIYRDGYFYNMVPDTTSFVDVGNAAVMHSYYVTAFCHEGETDPSNTVCAVIETDGLSPRAFEGEMTNKKIVFHWELPEQAEGIDAFVLYRKYPGEEYKQVKMLPGTSTSYTLNNQQLGKRYFFKLTALYGEQGEVESSPARTALHPELYYLEINATHLPSGLRLEDQGDGTVLLQWDPALLAESYNLYRNGELYRENITEAQYTDTLSATESMVVYQVTGMLKGVESSPSNRACWGNVSVGETPTEALSVFPNPTDDTVWVQADGLSEVTVFNTAGQRLMHRHADASEMRLDLSGCPQGMVFLRIQTTHGVQVRKVVVMQ